MADDRKPPPPDEAQGGARSLLPPHWSELTSTQAEPLESELRRELPRAHLLFGRELRAIARRDGYDDVLFAPTAARTPVYWVHLTWSVETDPAWPWTEEYGDVAEFTEAWRRENPGDDA